MNKADWQAPTLDDIEEYETVRWLDEQLDRMECFAREHGADAEMLDAIDYLRDDNRRWLSSEIEELDRSGKLLLLRERASSH